MLLAARDALDFVRDLNAAAFEVSRLHQNAVIRSLEVIGEAAGQVSPDFRQAHPDLPWREMTGMRHRLIHGYAEVRLDVVWRAVQAELPSLIQRLEAILPGH